MGIAAIEKHNNLIPRRTTMKIKLITALTTVALFALPVADAFAGHYS